MWWGILETTIFYVQKVDEWQSTGQSVLLVLWFPPKLNWTPWYKI